MTRILVALFSLLPTLALAQPARSGAGEAGYKMGYLIGYFLPIIAFVVVIVGVVVWLAWLIFRKPKPPRDRHHRSGW
ncbi:MAG TPA: hypothetical protein VM469_03910 [Pseudoxanthomonas sp.]|jgi:uncharacterized membrane protein|nr:hypothetical protein [Pseudoxanthomonas sp.]